MAIFAALPLLLLGVVGAMQLRARIHRTRQVEAYAAEASREVSRAREIDRRAEALRARFNA